MGSAVIRISSYKMQLTPEEEERLEQMRENKERQKRNSSEKRKLFLERLHHECYMQPRKFVPDESDFVVNPGGRYKTLKESVKVKMP